MPLVRMGQKGAAANPKQGRDRPAALVSVCLKRVGTRALLGCRPLSQAGQPGLWEAHFLPSLSPLCVSQSSPEMTPRAAA